MHTRGWYGAEIGILKKCFLKIHTKKRNLSYGYKSKLHIQKVDSEHYNFFLNFFYIQSLNASNFDIN